MKRYKFIAITDEVTDCDCCGRTNLKNTIVIQEQELSEYFFFGSQCAAKALTWGIKEVNKESKKAHEQYEIEARNFYKKHPNLLLIDKEIEECNQKRLSYSERPTKKWRELEEKARKDTLEEFPFAKRIY